MSSRARRTASCPHLPECAPWWRRVRESRDEPALPRVLDGTGVIAAAHEGDRFVGGHSVEHGETCQRGPGSAAPAAAGDLDPPLIGELPELSQRVEQIVGVGRQPEVRPPNPPRGPRHRTRVAAKEVEPEVWSRFGWFAGPEPAPAHQPAAGQDQHRIGGSLPTGAHPVRLRRQRRARPVPQPVSSGTSRCSPQRRRECRWPLAG